MKELEKFYLLLLRVGFQALEEIEKSAAMLRKPEYAVFRPILTWMHYLLLMKVDPSETRAFMK